MIEAHLFNITSPAFSVENFEKWVKWRKGIIKRDIFFTFGDAGVCCDEFVVAEQFSLLLKKNNSKEFVVW